MPDKHRYPKEVSERIIKQIRDKVDDLVTDKTSRGLIGKTRSTKQRMYRVELLDLQNPREKRRFEIINNDAERYELKDFKTVFTRADSYVEWKVFVEYYELGEDLPLTKTREELWADDTAKLAETEEPPEISDDFEDPFDES